MEKGGGKILFFVFIFTLGAVLNLVFVGRVFAYDTNIAHPGIAGLAVKAYNKNNTNKITAEQYLWIQQGVVEEDVPTRWLNHFYDPVYNRGLWFITQHESSKAWSKDPVGQKSYSKGDNSWQRAISDYRSGDQELAFKELGHSIHLVSDALVPAHTRDDIHAPKPDSYEEYVKNNWDRLNKDINVRPIYKNKLEDVFDEAANYSNNNFYSDDTIEDKNYKIIDTKEKIFKIDNDDYSFYQSSKDGFNLFFDKNVYSWQDILKGNVKKDLSLNNNVILSDYAHHLLPKAVAYSAGAIKLFLDETQKNQTDKLPLFRSNLGGLVDNLGSKAINTAEKIYKGNASQANNDGGIINQATDAIVNKIETIGRDINKDNPISVPSTPVSSPKPPSSGSSLINNPVIGVSSGSLSAPIISDIENISTVIIPISTSTSDNSVASSTTSTEPSSGSAPTTSTISTSTPDEAVPTSTPTSTVSTSTEPAPTSTPDDSVTTSTASTTIATSTEPSTTSTPITTSTPTSTYTAPAVVVNEIAWAGTSQFTQEDEYIELYNNSDQDIQLFPATDPQKWWKLKISGQEIVINKIKNSTIPAHGYYLFENPDDRTVNEIDGDILYAGRLSDAGARVELFDSENNLVDEVNASAGWFAGSAANYSSMEKLSPVLDGNASVSWQTNQGPRFAGKVDGGGDVLPLNGSPKQSNFGSIVLRAIQVEIERTLKKSDHPYILTYYEIPVGKTLNIEEGAVMKAYYPDSKMEVKGTLNISGSNTQAVVIASDSQVEKSWQGLMFYPGSQGNISGLNMSYAGKPFKLPNANTWDPKYSYGVYSNGAILNINGSNFSNNGDIDIYNTNSSSSISNTSFQNGITAIEHHAGTLSLDNISVNNFSNSTGAIYVKDIWPQLNIVNFSNSVNGAVNIGPATITSSVSIGIDLPINLENLTIESGGILTVNKGVTFKLPQYSNIFIKGALNLDGTPDAPIKFVGPGGINKYWGHLVFDGGIGNLNSVDFSGGGYNYPGDSYHGVISANNNSQLTLENCQLIDNRLPVEIIQINSSTVNLNNTSLGYSTKDTFFPNVKGIQVNTGALSLNNSFFYNLTTGITTYSINPLPQFSVTNMDPRNFINVDTYWDPANWFPAFTVSP